MSHAQMIAKAWLDDSYRAVLIAQGIQVPPRPNDLADEELDTSLRPYDERSETALMTYCITCQCCVCG